MAFLGMSVKRAEIINNASSHPLSSSTFILERGFVPSDGTATPLRVSRSGTVSARTVGLRELLATCPGHPRGDAWNGSEPESRDCATRSPPPLASYSDSSRTLSMSGIVLKGELRVAWQRVGDPTRHSPQAPPPPVTHSLANARRVQIADRLKITSTQANAGHIHCATHHHRTTGRLVAPPQGSPPS